MTVDHSICQYPPQQTKILKKPTRGQKLCLNWLKSACYKKIELYYGIIETSNLLDTE